MTTIPKLTVVYAWQTPYSHGATFETEADARADSDQADSGAKLLRVYVDPTGKVVHTEVVT